MYVIPQESKKVLLYLPSWHEVSGLAHSLEDLLQLRGDHRLVLYAQQLSQLQCSAWNIRLMNKKLTRRVCTVETW